MASKKKKPVFVESVFTVSIPENYRISKEAASVLLTEESTMPTVQNELMTIVIAWWEDEKQWDGEAFQADKGKLPTFLEVKVAKALVWKHNAEKTDLENAKAFAGKEYGEQGVQVFEYATDEDCLNRARRDLGEA